MSILKTQYKAVSREQFKLLREAKQLVKKEFGEDLALQDDAVLDKIYEYAMRSDGEHLFELFNELSGDADVVEQAAQPQKPSRAAKAQAAVDLVAKIKVGDIVDGQRCISMYRGKPVFEPA